MSAGGTNGVSHGPYAGWLIVMIGNRIAVGNPQRSLTTGDLIALEPGYELLVQQGQTPQGWIRMKHAGPWLTMHSITRIEVPAGAPFWCIDALDADERRTMYSVLETGEQLVRQMRAEAQGVTIVPGDYKLPPMPGRMG